MPKIRPLRGKRCMLVTEKLDADFSVGCVLPLIAHSFLVTHPTLPSEGPELRQ
jgi:hypothetical protein